MFLRTFSLAAIALATFSFDAHAIVYRDDGSLSLSEGLASQPQFSGTGIISLAQDEGTGSIIAPNWVLTAKHVVTGDSTFTPTSNAVTFFYAGGNQMSDAIYTDPNSDLALVHFATALPSNLAITAPNTFGSTLNVANQLIWNVGYGSYANYSNQGNVTSNPGFRLAGTNITDANSAGTPPQYLGFTNQNESGTEFESSTAPGDSGGPMFQQTGYQWRVVAEVYGAGSAGFIDTNTAYDNFITTTTGLTFTPRAAPTALFWNSTYTNTSSNSANVASSVTDGAGTWDTTRLDFTDKTYTFSYENGTLLPVTFGVGNGAAGTVTLGSAINISNLIFNAAGSGNYTLAGSGSNTLNLQSTGSTMTVATGVSPTISAVIDGAGALTKAGAGTLTLTGANGFSGGAVINGGTLAINGEGALGGASYGGLTFNGGTLQYTAGATGNGSLDVTATQPAGVAKPVTISAGGATIDTNGNTVAFANPIGNGGTGALTKTGLGTLTLNAANTYTGGTILNAGTLTITNAGGLGTGGVTYSGTAMLNLGGTTYTAPTLGFTTASNAGFAGTASNGNLVITGAAGLNFVGSNTGATTDALNLGALTSFTYNQPGQSINIYGASTGTGTSFAPTNVTQVTLASTNIITASAVNLGTTGNAASNPFVLSQLDLGATNTLNTGSIAVGGYRGDGLLDFAAGLSNAAVTLRGTNGTGAVTSVLVGENSSGNGSSFGTVNLSAGSVNALITTLTVGQQATGNAQTAQGSFTMGTGTMNLGSLVVADNTDTNAAAVSNGTFTQNGGSVLANTVTLGSNRSAGAPTLTSVYNLGTASSAASLSAAAINIVGSAANAATGTINAASRATLNWNNGTISNYDATGFSGGNLAGGAAVQNLSITGLTGGGAGSNSTTLAINLVDGTGVTHTFSAEVGQSITVAATAQLTGTGALTKAGAGTLTLAGTANNYTGTTVLNAGTTLINGSLTGTASLAVNSTATLGGAGVVTTGSNGGVTLASGGHIAPGASGAGSVGMLSFALGTGTFDASAATAANNGAFVFDLASTTASDSVRLNSGMFNLGTGTLGLNDFAFTTQTGFAAGTYTLLSSASAISLTSLDATNLFGTVGGLPATLSDSGTAILLTVSAAVPEPAAWVLLALGAVSIFGVRRRL